jgi:hypothetical protein
LFLAIINASIWIFKVEPRSIFSCDFAMVCTDVENFNTHTHKKNFNLPYLIIYVIILPCMPLYIDGDYTRILKTS